MLRNHANADLYAQSRRGLLRLLFLDKIWRSLLVMAAAGYCFISGRITLGFDANENAVRTYEDAIKELLDEIDQNRKDKASLAQQLEQSMAEIKTLHGFIPICARCKKIRDDKGYRDNVEAYVQAHSDAKFTHLLCPPCGELLYGELWKEVMADLPQQ